MAGVCVVVLAAAGCGSGARAAGAPAGPGKACPSGERLPGGQGQIRDYVDAVRLHGRNYHTPSGPGEGLADESKLGAVVGTVLCSKAQHDSRSRTEPEWTDPGSTFVPDGGPLYAVTGVPVDCQVAARSNDGRLHLYTAEEPGRPANCPP